jgi:hypothetical protein
MSVPFGQSVALTWRTPPTGACRSLAYALSAFTLIGLSLGERPLAVASVLMGLISRSDRALGLTLPLLDRSVESLVGLVDAMQGPSDVPLANEANLTKAFGESPDLHANDGCVPIRSQLWGKLVWAGLGDHLDVLGHYRDATPETRIELRHHDWLTSGSRFDDASFEGLMDAIAGGMVEGAG